MYIGNLINSLCKQKNVASQLIQSGWSVKGDYRKVWTEQRFVLRGSGKKIANTFEVSLDYLVGEGINASFDKKNLNRIEDTECLDQDTKKYRYFFIDNCIQNIKAKKL